MSLFMFLAQLWGALQMFVVSSWSRACSWKTILAAFMTGMTASTLVVLGIEASWTRLFVVISHRSLSSTTAFASYAIDPFVEELCKILPLLLVLLIPRVRRLLGLTDTLIIGAALGSGFGLAEILFRFSHNARSATWVGNGGYWNIAHGFGVTSVPGLGAILTSWLPLGATPHSLFSARTHAIGINLHLAWSALVGLSVGLLIRGRGRWKWTALAPFLIACLSHAGNNAVASGVSFRTFVLAGFAPLVNFAALFSLVALAVAGWADHWVIANALADEPTLRFPAEAEKVFGFLKLALTRSSKPWSLIQVWSFVLERRSFALTKAARQQDECLPPVRAKLASQCTMLEHNQLVSAPAFFARFARPQGQPARPPAQPLLRFTPRRLLVFLLALPPLLYFVVGNFSWTSKVQVLLAKRSVFSTLIAVLIVGMIWRGVNLIRQSLGLRRVVQQAHGHTIVTNVFSLLTSLGGLGLGAFGLVSFLGGNGPLQPAISNAHLLDALGQGVLLAVIVFAMIALLCPELLPLAITVGEVSAITAGESAAFWTGPGAAAAATLVGTTIAETDVGEALANAADGMASNEVAWEVIREEIWEPASQLFAEGASGTPIAFVNKLDPTTIWSQTEFPTLMNNPNVDQIIVKYMQDVSVTADEWFKMGESWASGGRFLP